jgi:hypothetical protein
MHHDVKKNVAKFLPEIFGILSADRLEQLVSLFDKLWKNRFVSLLAIPGTAPGCAQSGHDLTETIKLRCGGLKRRVGHAVLSAINYELSTRKGAEPKMAGR